VGGGPPPEAEAGDGGLTGMGLDDVLVPWVVVVGGPPPEAEVGDGGLIAPVPWIIVGDSPPETASDDDDEVDDPLQLPDPQIPAATAAHARTNTTTTTFPMHCFFVKGLFPAFEAAAGTVAVGFGRFVGRDGLLPWEIREAGVAIGY
jgi:hypothetical protein